MKKSEKQDLLKNSSISSKGAIFFAYNNNQLNYIKLAYLSASSVRKYLNLPCTLITDDGSLKYSKGLKINDIFDNIIVHEKSESIPNIRNYDR